MLSCRFCFKAFPLLGRGQVYRSMDDPTVCEACYKVGTDLNARMREQAAAQVDARDSEIDITPQGGKHSAIGRAFHHLDPELMLALAGVLYTGGAKYGRDNWKNISVEDHLNHAFNHVYLFQTDREAEELEHAILRLMFAWTVENEGGTYNAAN